jgi:hypothetical protein
MYLDGRVPELSNVNTAFSSAPGIVPRSYYFPAKDILSRLASPLRLTGVLKSGCIPTSTVLHQTSNVFEISLLVLLSESGGHPLYTPEFRESSPPSSKS